MERVTAMSRGNPGDLWGRWPVLLGLSLLVGCGPSPDAGPPEARNLTLDRVMTAGEALFGVRAVQTLGSGDIMVLTGAEPFLFRYTHAGEVVDTLPLRKGQGPRDLLNPWGLLRIPGSDSVAVLDAGNRKLIFLAPGEGVGDSRPHPLPAVSLVRGDIRDVVFGDPHQTVMVGDRVVTAVYPNGVLRQSDLSYGLLLSVDLAGETVDTLLDFRSSFFRDAEPEVLGENLQASPLWAACGREQILVFDPVGMQVLEMDEGGRSRSKWDVELHLSRLSTVDVQRYLRHQATLELRGAAYDTVALERRVHRMARDARNHFPALAPPAVRMLCDSRGRAWLQLFRSRDHALGYSREWIVLDGGSGRGIRVRFPINFTPLTLKDGWAFGIVTEGTGLERIGAVLTDPS
jgi:hypothetical protein